MTLFVGLGNPGSQYAHTRHNIGWRVIDRLVSETGARDISKTTFHGELFRHGNLFFLKPTTYMNHSGRSVQAVKHFFKIDTDDVIVIHDDIDLPFGALRFKKGGGHAGHNGLRSIDAAITPAYTRVRMGVGKPEYKSQVPDYVLHDFSDQESEHLDAWIAHTAQACLALTRQPFDEVRTRFSRKALS
jgi:PTH1 family peptidyl-tRNA hydrolase